MLDMHNVAVQKCRVNKQEATDCKV